ncbi:MAG: hypothetical protein GY820_11045 [Gammaproteobacteria bacterium]|nr:hypothetical protein [Gammaproteobacteria bacterium]
MTKFKGFKYGWIDIIEKGFSFGLLDTFNPIFLKPKLWVDPSDTSTLFQDAGGTTPVSSAGDPVGLVLDKSGNDNHLTAPSDAARPVYAVSESGDKLLQSDEVDDELSVTLPDLGADVTIAYTTQSELRIDEGETVSAGEYTLPQVDLLNYLMIDRQLTKSEKIELIRYLSRSAEGVNYGAVIDDMILACLNAVDVFVYDTSKDSDGGAWRKRCQHTSWYNETLNTATRGSRREFPAVAVIVAESNKVTIYDGDDPSLPMWMVFNKSGQYFLDATTLAVTMLNGSLCVSGHGNGLVVVDFLADAVRQYHTSGLIVRVDPSVVKRNTAQSSTTDASITLVNQFGNDVAITVLPDAPIDPATGLPVPTIAVATDGGVSVIKDDGTVVDATHFLGGNYSKTTAISFAGDLLRFNMEVIARTVWEIPLSEFSSDLSLNNNNTFETRFIQGVSGGNLAGYTIPAPLPTGQSRISGLHSGSGGGLTSYHRDPVSRPRGMVAYTTSTYNTGWMNGDIKGAFLSDTDDTDLVGAELVMNGDFATGDLTGWTDDSINGGSVAYSSGTAELTSVAAGIGGRLYQGATTVVGRRYRLTVDRLSGSSIVQAPGFQSDNGAGTVVHEFVATSTTSRITVLTFNAGTGVVDNISVKLADADRSVNG